MARPLRIQLPGLTYHVTARGVRQMDIYLDDVDRRRFLKLLAQVVQEHGLRCHAYCEMTNHYHLAVTTTDANLSRSVQQLNGEYAQWWNWRHGRFGHVFQARFDAQIVQDGAYFLNVCRYVVRNPVRAHIVRTPAQWTWSSYRATAGLVRLPGFMNCDRLMELLSPEEPGSGISHYRKFVMEPDADAVRLPREAILGDDEFVARFQPYRAHASSEVPLRQGRRALDAIFANAVTRAARNAAVLEAHRQRYAFADIARYLEVHPSTISKIVMAPQVPDREKSGDSRPDPTHSRRAMTGSIRTARRAGT